MNLEFLNYFENSSYQVLHSLLPPSDVTDDIDLMRLEHISACAIVKNRRLGYTISNIPLHLHKILWKSYLSEKYYSNDFTFEELPHLLYNWPLEEFTLKHLMPRLPPRRILFTNDWWGDYHRFYNYHKQRRNLTNFYVNVINAVIRSFKIEPVDCEGFTQHPIYDCKINKVDLTGYKLMSYNSIDIKEIKEIWLRNSFGKLEFVLDVVLFRGDNYGIESSTGWFNALTHSHKYNSYIIKLNHVTVDDTRSPVDDVKQMIEKCVSHGPISLNLRGDEIDWAIGLEQIFKTNAYSDNVISVRITDAVWTTSMIFLQYFNNLSHLNLPCNNLHGKLSSLKHMPKGLILLHLEDCELTNADLYHFRGTNHMTTLRELNLNHNCFSYDGNHKNLVELCLNLVNVQKIDLAKCKLESWPSSGLALLCHSFKSIPNVLYINLNGNIFSTDYIVMHIMKLKENLSLKYLNITLSPQFWAKRDDAKLFCIDINENFNISRSQLLFVEFSPYNI